ncbi:hypothetical protein DPMN_028723 [Dreissena polymorpha]|uniref:Uncharacterized protein n=1 Tax=Dreissena polymorpha TaxID=45954 RepID=A0A9D4REL7_DREPO|nr:hypothetical protein DPMN_028723 [Dreissena polymorpha]
MLPWVECELIAGGVTDWRKQTNRPTDRPTDQQTDQQTGQKQYVPHYYILSILSIVSMKEPHWKTMRISGIKPLWKTMRISGIKPESELRNILSILSLKEPGISTEKEPGIILSSKQGISALSTEHEITTMESHENIGKHRESVLTTTENHENIGYHMVEDKINKG